MSANQSEDTKPGIPNLNTGLWVLDFFYGLWMTQGYKLDHSISPRLLKHVGLIHVLPLAVHLCFCAEEVEGVILSHFYSLGFIIRDLLNA